MTVSPQNPTFHARCFGRCQDVTSHAGMTDEHGCEVGTQCQVCGAWRRKSSCSYTGEAPMDQDWRDNPDDRAKFEAEMARRGFLSTDVQGVK